jgi:hypothetical protein
MENEDIIKVLKDAADNVVRKADGLEQILNKKESFLSKAKKYIFNYWLFLILIVLLAINICLNISHAIIDNQNLILAFVGILATFIVVSNYAQVKDIERAFNKKENELNKKIENIENSNKNTLNKIDSLRSEAEEFKYNINNKIPDIYNFFRSVNCFTDALRLFNSPAFDENYKSYFISILDSLFDSLTYYNRIKNEMDKRFDKDANDSMRIVYILKVIEKVKKLNKGEKLNVNFESYSKWNFGLDYIGKESEKNTIHEFIKSINCMSPYPE